LHENYQKPAPIEGQEDVKSDKKKLMRNYSDLFNLPQYENAQKEKKEMYILFIFCYFDFFLK